MVVREGKQRRPVQWRVQFFGEALRVRLRFRTLDKQRPFRIENFRALWKRFRQRIPLAILMEQSGILK